MGDRNSRSARTPRLVVPRHARCITTHRHVAMFVCAFMIIGRPENVYWGILFVMLLIPGLAFAPTALGRLTTRLR